MLGSEVPDLATTPCGGCGAAFVTDEPVIWDPYHPGDPRLAAYPYHPGCAAKVLPPEQPDASMQRCAICSKPLSEGELQQALTTLRARFDVAQVEPSAPTLVWRLAQREPHRAWLPEHLQCLLEKVQRPRELGALPGKVISPEDPGA